MWDHLEAKKSLFLGCKIRAKMGGGRGDGGLEEKFVDCFNISLLDPE